MTDRGIIAQLHVRLTPLLDYNRKMLAKEIKEKGEDVYSYERGIYQGMVNALEVYKVHLRDICHLEKDRK